MKCKLKGCQKPATVKPYEKGLYCSSRCALAAVRTRAHQKRAGRAGALANIAKYRGTGVKGYVKENGRHQHRIVMEKKLGRKLRKGEIVHHVDHNKKNNDPKNLRVMTQSRHAKLHYRPSSIQAAILKNTKYGPVCRRSRCQLPNKKGRAYCGSHQYRFEKYGEK
jgi:hypothetical protein